jgi:hypothetical protein
MLNTTRLLARKLAVENFALISLGWLQLAALARACQALRGCSASPWPDSQNSTAIRTAFHPTTPGFKGLIDRILADRERLFKGPYVSVALPFQQGPRRDWFPQIPLAFPANRHQELASERLLPGTPRHTLVATGTGSDKTESFLLPLLQYCRQQHSGG